MTDSMIQIFDIDSVKSIVESSGKEYASIAIYRGYVNDQTKNAVLQYQMKPVFSGAKKRGCDFGEQWSRVENNLFGEFTFVTKPLNEIFYVYIPQSENSKTSFPSSQNIPALNGFANQTPVELQKVIDENVKLKIEVEKLKMENKNLKEQIERIDSTGYKLDRIIGSTFTAIFGEQPSEIVNSINSTNDMAHEQIEITEDMTDFEKSIAVLHNLIGERDLIRMAHYLQANPGKVALLKSFLP